MKEIIELRILYIMIGIPGSGKTTAARKLNGTRISFDDVKESLYGAANIGKDQDEIWNEFQNRLYQALRNKKNIIIDYQGLNRSSRKRFIKKYSKFFDKIVAVYMDTPLEVCLTRNQQRSRHVSEDCIIKSSSRLVPPSFEEGFDKIIIHKVN